MFEDSVTYVAVLNITNSLTDNTTPYTSLPAGAGGFFHASTDEVEGLAEESALAAGIKYFFAWKDTNGILHKTNVFSHEQAINRTKLATTALVEQITFLGYDGVSAGAMDAEASTYFGLKLVLNHTFGLLNNSALIKTIPFKTSATGSQSELALGLALAGYNAFKGQPNQDVIFDAICNTATNANYDFSNDATVVKGSTVFNVASNLTYNTAAGTLAVGDFVRFDDALNGDVALDNPVYKVTAINTLAVTVDRPINVPSGAWTDAGEAVQVITAAQGAAADWGVRMTGNTPDGTSFNPLTDTPFVVSFSVLSGDFETATVSYTTKALIGTGTYQLVAAMEAYTQYQFKDRIVSTYPTKTVQIDSVAGNTYCLYNVDIINDNFISATTGLNPKSKSRLVIAVLTGLQEITDFDTILAVS